MVRSQNEADTDPDPDMGIVSLYRFRSRSRSADLSKICYQFLMADGARSVGVRHLRLPYELSWFEHNLNSSYFDVNSLDYVE